MPKTTFEALANRVIRSAKTLPQRVSNTAIAAALEVVQDLNEHTPVDTSKALSNWQTRLNSPVSTAIPAFVAGLQGSSKNQSAQVVLTAAKATLFGKKQGIPIYISNVLPYITPLNSGTSTKEPAGFVQRAVLLGRIRVKKAKLKL